ncbi:MAG: hypothetical protein XU12_C0001G0135 [Deltaproteobacteria bacterium CSP1-8]|nr:MAG: hypothetical protein XU12_C0001G0135 [Deltaproteobacteria bacterium CSP1-8]
MQVVSFIAPASYTLETIPVPPFLSAQYNPPWTISPFRRNEIIVRIR